jgi:F0F1-type ATP synthase alpha subunit
MEPIRASEINEIIRKQIENFETGVTVTEVGTVIKSATASPSCTA